MPEMLMLTVVGLVGVGLGAVAAWFVMEKRRPPAPARPAPEAPLAREAFLTEPMLTQDDYAEILEADRARIARDFAWDRGAGTWFCARCRRRATLVGICHPIWDGPFDGAGSGAVDSRDVPWCRACDRIPDLGGLVPGAAAGQTPGRGDECIASGIPVRLPWLDSLPIRLRPELFERAAFHRLPVQVERVRPPAVDAPSEEGPSTAR